jgi:hypothetical protein
MPIPGVSVLVKGTGTQTDFDGKYVMHASQILLFSYIGMLSQKLKPHQHW